jgi:hypothetical protein
MKTVNDKPVAAFFLIPLLTVLACNALAGSAVPTPMAPTATITETAIPIASATQTELPTETPVPSPTVELPTPTIDIPHVLIPMTSVKSGDLVKDVVSVDTASEKRAPYGDSYRINLFERPFLQDMTYIPDLDIESYNVNKDEKFYYVSIKLVGADPNNEIGINYGVELDIDADGYGDYIIIAHPPYSVDWSTDNVQVVQDTNRDTGGLSPTLSDAPLPGDGYETQCWSERHGPICLQTRAGRQPLHVRRHCRCWPQERCGSRLRGSVHRIRGWLTAGQRGVLSPQSFVCSG